MTWFQVEVRGDLGAAIRAEGRALRKGVTQGLAQTGRDTRRDLLREFRQRLRAGKRGVGQKSINGLVAVRQKPRRGFDDWSPRVWVQSRAVYKRGGVRQQPIDLFDVFDTGAIITAASGKFLAIPTENAPLKKGRGTRRATPKEAMQSGVRFDYVPIAPDKALLVDAKTRAVMWVLVRRIRIQKRLSIDAVFQRNAARVLDNIDDKLALELARITLRV